MKRFCPGIYVTAFLALFPWMIYAQWPTCDLYISTFGSSGMTISSPVFLNRFHTPGYNNQPAFAAPNQWLISSTRNTNGTDILWLNVQSKEFSHFTKTDKVSEFSPQVMPDNNHISVVRIEEDGKTQTLWAYPINRSNYGKNLLPHLDNIGYYTWLDSFQVAVFLVDSVHTLAIANVANQKVVYLQENIGRCLKSKDQYLYFTRMEENGIHVVKKYDLHNLTIENVLSLPAGTEDFELSATKDIYYASGGRIFLCQPKNYSLPILLKDLESSGIRNIKRMAIRDQHIVFVNQP